MFENLNDYNTIEKQYENNNLGSYDQEKAEEILNNTVKSFEELEEEISKKPTTVSIAKK